MPRNIRNRKEAAAKRNELYTKLAHKQQLWWAQAEAYINAVAMLGDVPPHSRKQTAECVKQYRLMPLHKQWMERKMLLGFIDYILGERSIISPVYCYFGRMSSAPHTLRAVPVNKGDIRLSFGETPS